MVDYVAKVGYRLVAFGCDQGQRGGWVWVRGEGVDVWSPALGEVGSWLVGVR